MRLDVLLLRVIIRWLYFDALRFTLLHGFCRCRLLGLFCLLFLIALLIEDELGPGPWNVIAQVPRIFSCHVSFGLRNPELELALLSRSQHLGLPRNIIGREHVAVLSFGLLARGRVSPHTLLHILLEGIIGGKILEHAYWFG